MLSVRPSLRIFQHYQQKNAMYSMHKSTKLSRSPVKQACLSLLPIRPFYTSQFKILAIIVPNRTLLHKRYSSISRNSSNSSNIDTNQNYAATNSKSTTSMRRRHLEDDANQYPSDASRQSMLYRELNGLGDFHSVISRFDSGQFASNDEAYREYIKAVVATGKYHLLKQPQYSHSTNMPPVLTINQHAPPGPNYPRTGWLQAIFGLPQHPSRSHEHSELLPDGTTERPFRVQLVSGGPASVKMLHRFLLLSFIVFVIMLLNPKLFKRVVMGDRVKSVAPGQKSDVKFSDVLGCDEAIEEVQEIVEFLRNPSKMISLGAKLPKGFLLTGPPGTGKTLLAKAVAGEAGVHFFYATGSEFEEMFVGVGASRVRDLFAAARSKAPCVIFIDEIDSVGGKRVFTEANHHRATINQLLTEMDGFDSGAGIIVIGATNNPDSLDPALLRPGRFDRQVAMPVPDLKGRLAILQHYSRKVKMEPGINMDTVARRTSGMTGADLSNLINTAALQAATRNKAYVTIEELEFARDRILMGQERKSAQLTLEVRKLTAYHEGGHALVAMLTEGSDPIHKATIVPRGHALGMVMQMPEDDQPLRSKKQMLAHMDVAMGGRVAEELIFGKDNITTGASSDFQQATRIARAMVMHYGMSDKIGRISIDPSNDKLSPDMQKAVDQEIQSILQDSYARAQNILTSNKDKLHRLANALIEFETLSQEEIRTVISGQPINPSRSHNSAAASSPSFSLSTSLSSRSSMVSTTHPSP